MHRRCYAVAARRRSSFRRQSSSAASALLVGVDSGTQSTKACVFDAGTGAYSDETIDLF